MDVKTTFLNGDLDEEIYMNQSKGFVVQGQESKVCVEGEILMFPNRIWGSQAETQRWALETKPKGYRRGVSLPK